MDQRGPIGFGGGDANLTRHVSNYPVTLNLYRNVFNSPTNLFDPTGYFPQDDETTNGNSGQSYNPTIPAGSETWVWPWDEGADWSFGSTTTLWWNKSTHYGGAASHGFYVTGGKGLVNGGASAITATATLGGVTDVELIAPTDNDLGYGASKAIVQGSSELLIGVATGGTAAALSKGSRVSQVAGGVVVGYDALGNAVNAGRGVHDAFQDGINLDNATRIAGGAAGISGNLIPNIRAPRGVLDGLSKSGASVKLPNGLTRAGHAFEKHAAGQRSANSKFPKLSGNIADKNAFGQGILDDILTDPGTTRSLITGGNFKGGTRFTAPDGRQTVFDKNGVFQYFGE